MGTLARWAWGTLGLNVAVILWGAFVRATGSGAGCGEHWPLCNGELIPRSPAAETIIELTHRATSGVALIAVAVLAYRAFAVRPAQPSLRRAAAASLVLILLEAAIGAGLVLFQLVADNETMARALFMSVHLVNTFLLLGALTLTAYFASGGAPFRLRSHPASAVLFGAAIVGLIAAGASGAVAALGDTLYPAGSVAEAVWQDLSATSHFLVRLRVWHPVLAVTAAILTAVALRLGGRLRPGAISLSLATGLEALLGLQIVAGVANVLLLAPVWLQLVHLLLADLVWIGVMLATASALRVAEPAASSALQIDLVISQSGDWGRRDLVI
jgi:cytochrome c oxidase assembly protein subunit 15